MQLCLKNSPVEAAASVFILNWAKHVRQLFTAGTTHPGKIVRIVWEFTKQQEEPINSGSYQFRKLQDCLRIV